VLVLAPILVKIAHDVHAWLAVAVDHLARAT
jgi:hypothetical protein